MANTNNCLSRSGSNSTLTVSGSNSTLITAQQGPLFANEIKMNTFRTVVGSGKAPGFGWVGGCPGLGVWKPLGINCGGAVADPVNRGAQDEEKHDTAGVGTTGLDTLD